MMGRGTTTVDERAVNVAGAEELRRRRDEADGTLHEPPIVLISSCKDETHTGDFTRNGGVKLYSTWLKVLRRAGYQAFIVTHDGRYAPWLIEHQPHVSIETVRRWKAAGIPLRFVTGWIDASAFIDLADNIYFCDCEISATARRLFPLLAELMQTKVKTVATNSRTQQAWYMATFHRPVAFIPEWSDEAYWRPDAARRVAGRVGYMLEGPASAAAVEQIGAHCAKAGVPVELLHVQGDERDVLEQMQTCDVFLGLNPGKDVLWGEGCPRSPQESLHAGCVLVAYDVHGNREYLIDGYNGFIVPRGRTDRMAERVVELLTNPELKEQIRAAAIDLASRAFSSHGRWRLLRDFLDLEDRPVTGHSAHHTASMTRKERRRDELSRLLGATAFIGEDEIPVLNACAAQAPGTLVEIGAGHGASAALMLSNMPPGAMAHSVDPFVRDSMGELHASARQCRCSVLRMLEGVGKASMFPNWCLHVQTSDEAAASWAAPIDFLYIDGDHRYETVARDFADWSRHVVPGGRILLHDSRREEGVPDETFARGWAGPTRLATELRQHDCVRLIDEAFSLTVWERTGAPCTACETQMEGA